MKHGSLISPDEPSFSFGRATAGFNFKKTEAAGDFVTIPDADLLFNGAFRRVGDDLSITGRDGAHVLVEDYFRTDKRATLLSPEGAALTPAVVEALAGPLAPGQYAQAGSAPSASPPVGRVDKVEGNASVVRNGVTIVLNAGDVVLKGDVVQTGANAALGIVFSDGTAFSLAANARMVLNDFVYDAGASNNSALVSLVQGSISFVAGQVAKTGDMRVDTPVATMGIRGTAVLVEINANNGQTKFSVMVEPNGTVGSFNLYDKGTGTLIATVNNSTVGWVVTPTGPLQVIAQQVQKTQVELARELSIVQQVFQIFNQGQQNPFDPSQPPQQQQQPTDPSNRGDNPNPQNTQTAQGTQFIPSNDGVITVTVTQPAAGGGSGNSQSSNSSSNSNSSSSGTGTSSTDTTTTTTTDSTSSVTYIFGTDGNDILTGTANDDLLYAFGGDDIIIAGHGGGDDYYEGGSGFDEIRFTSTELGVEFHLNVTTVNGVKVSTATGVTETGTDTFVGIEKIVGGSGDDVFVLYDDADWKIDGREGFDIIRLAGDLDLTQESSDLYASNIELLDLDQNLSNLVRFTVGDIRTADSEMNALRVHADAGDAIELSDRYEVDGQLIEGEWRQSTQAVIFEDGYSDGRTFRQWEFVSREDDVPVTLATLYVQDTAPVSVVDGGHVFDFPLGEANQYGRRLVRTEADDGDGYFTSQGFGHYYPDVSVSDRDYHLGEDWNESGQSAADLGDPVFAIGHGTVVFSGDGGSGWGNVVIIRHELADGEHGGFVTSLYGHLDALEVGVGDTVHRGQPIGTIGDHPGGPHLHLEIREGTNPDALIVGHGYSEQPRPAGWLDPSEFIASHQNAAGNRWTVSPQDAVVSEDDGFVTFTIARPLSDIAQTVFVSTVDTHGSANEQDYQYWYNVPVAFAPGESAREVVIHIIDGAITEDNETFGVIVQQSPDDPVSVNLASTTFTILDDDMNGFEPGPLLLKPGPEGQDLWITSFYSYSDNYGVDGPDLRVGGWGDSYHSLLKFDLTDQGLPTQIDNATLRLYNYLYSDYVPTGMYVDKLNTAWTESYGWRDYGLSYTNIGTVGAPVPGWIEIDITAAVNDWLTNPSSNQGIQLRPFGTNHNMSAFVSSDATDEIAQYRPELMINWEDWSIEPDSFVAYEDFGLWQIPFTITRADADTAATVYVSTAQVHGFSNEQDYLGLLNQPVTFDVGQTTSSVFVMLLDDMLPERDEAFEIIVQNAPDDPITTFLASASFIIRDNDDISFLARASNAAYFVAPAPSETHGPGINNDNQSAAAEADYLSIGSAIHLFTAADLPSLAPMSVFNPDYPDFTSRGLVDDGIYVNGNAAALIGGWGDSLFIAFRGTNDAEDTNLLGTGLGGGSPDQDHWFDFLGPSNNIDTGMPEHYDLLAPLVEAIDDYLTNHPISNVYVTGHSLGASMAQRYMDEHIDDPRFEAVTFASPGYPNLSAASDDQISNIRISGDPVALWPDISWYDQRGDEYRIVDFDGDYGPDFANFTNAILHDMSLYRELANFLTEYLEVTDSLSDDPAANYASILVDIYRSPDDWQISRPGGIISGTATNDIIRTNTGSDIIVGDLGDDTFVFRYGDGHDVIGDFSRSTGNRDTIDLNFVSSFDELRPFIETVNVGQDTLIHLGDDSVTLLGVNADTLTENDFVFHQRTLFPFGEA